MLSSFVSFLLALSALYLSLPVCAALPGASLSFGREDKRQPAVVDLLVGRATGARLGSFWVYPNISTHHTYATPFSCSGPGGTPTTTSGQNWIAFSNNTLQTIWVTQGKLGLQGCNNFTLTPTPGENMAWDGLAEQRVTCASSQSVVAYALTMCATCADDEAVISYGSRVGLGCGQAMGSISSFSIDATYAPGVNGDPAQA